MALKEIAIDDLAQDVQAPILVVDVERGEIGARGGQADRRRHFVVGLLADEARIVPPVAEAEGGHAVDLLAFDEFVELDAEGLLFSGRAAVGTVALKADAHHIELIRAPDDRGFDVGRVIRVLIVVRGELLEPVGLLEREADLMYRVFVENRAGRRRYHLGGDRAGQQQDQREQ